MALTKEDLQAIQALLEPLKAGQQAMQADIATLKQGQADIATLKQGHADLSDTLQTVKNSQMRVELEQFPRIAAALDGHKLNSEKLDAIQKNLEDITPTVQALEILHETGYAK